jgi:hypothetical protein
MTEQPGFFRRHAVRLAALLLISALYGFARQPALPDGERQSLAGRFAFDRAVLSELPTGAGPERRMVRPVHPSLRSIASWISSVGAGVALADLDGDGLPNDECHVDTRVDLVYVAPVPGTGDRYAAFSLDPGPGRFDRAVMAPMGCLPSDFNEDGLADVLVYYWGRPPLIFLRQAVDGAPNSSPSAATYRAVDVADPAERWYTNALTSADVDGDGHLDLIVGNYFPDGARILDTADTGSEHMHRSMSRSENGGTNRLLLWQSTGLETAGPDVKFVDVKDAFDPQTTLSWTLAVGAADLDGDLLPEIYFGNDFGNDRLLHNLSTPGHPRFAVLEGHRGFTTPASKVLGHDSFKGMGIDFADLNGDGVPDMYVSNIAQNFALEESHFVWVSNGPAARISGQMRDRVAPFEDRSEDLGLSRSGWSWDARFADFDNDGIPEAMQAVGFARGEKNRWPELHELAMGNDNNMISPAAWPHFTPGDDLSGHLWNPFFVRSTSGRYFDLAHDVPGLGDSHVSRGIAIADVDGDGRLDFAVANQWDASYFYRNTARQTGTALELDLRLSAVDPASRQTKPGLSRPAVGAAATVLLPGGRRLAAQVDGGSGHSGKRAPMLHFGLGKVAAGTPLQVDVRWRDGAGRVRAETLRLAPGRHRIVLGETL